MVETVRVSAVLLGWDRWPECPLNQMQKKDEYFISGIVPKCNQMYTLFSLSCSYKNGTLEHKNSLKSLVYVYSNSQKYIEWIKMINF